MYPRVKVRDAEEMKIMVKVEMSCAVRTISSLSLEKGPSKILTPATNVHDSSQPNAKISKPQIASSNGKKKNVYSLEHKAKTKGHVKDQKLEDDHILPLARTSPNSVPKISLKPLTVVPKCILKKDDSTILEDADTNIKTSFVPMPRAVLSSPENDEIIGSQNQALREKQVALRKQAPENDHVLKEKKLGSAVKIRKSTGTFVKEDGSNNVTKRKHSSVPRQRPPFKF